jgi:hypothetical protein
MKVLPNAFGIAAMFTLDPDTPELATALFQNTHVIYNLKPLMLFTIEAAHENAKAFHDKCT